MLVCIVYSREVCLAVRLVSCKKLWQISPWVTCSAGQVMNTLRYFECLSSLLLLLLPPLPHLLAAGSEPHVKDVTDLHEGNALRACFYSQSTLDIAGYGCQKSCTKRKMIWRISTIGHSICDHTAFQRLEALSIRGQPVHSATGSSQCGKCPPLNAHRRGRQFHPPFLHWKISPAICEWCL